MRWCAVIGLAMIGLTSPMADDARWNQVEVSGLEIQWRHVELGIELLLSAPSSGWVAVGFNDRNDIVGTELLMAAVQGGQGIVEHHRVLAPGVHEPVGSLGSLEVVLHASVALNDHGYTTAQLVIDQSRLERLTLTKGQPIWLIAAYSIAPEFDHHSRMRRHLRVIL